MKKRIVAALLFMAMLVSFGLTAVAEEEKINLEMWFVNNGLLETKENGPTCEFYREVTGVGLWQPYVEWNGGSTYQEQLNLRIAANDTPPIFQVVNGMEVDLMKNGALLDLTDLLPEKAPNLWNAVPQEVWDVIKTYDPSGEGRIYTIPSVVDYPLETGLIHKDWLDYLNLEMPTTQEEYVNVLRAFLTGDPNQNGIADELPTGGRAEARWMDHLFAMYGVAMWEGFPDWDIYDGELTYSAITPNMKAALQFCADLYAEGLMDPETLLNDKAAWDGKINSNMVGSLYHWAQTAYEYDIAIYNSTGMVSDIRTLPIISAPGFEGFYTAKYNKGPLFAVANTDDEATIDAVMKVFNAYADASLYETFYCGVEGMHHEVIDGKKKRLPDDPKTMENLILQPYNYLSTVESSTTLLDSVKPEGMEWAYEQAIDNIKAMPAYGKHIAGDGMPNSVYDGYPDIQNRTLYAEYASKIIIGEYDIDKFDEFVEKWKATGGDAVTEKARAWYAQVVGE